MELEWLLEGGVTSPLGYQASGVYAGIKTYGEEPRYDVGILFSTADARVAGVFTKNRVVGAPVELCRERVATGRGRAVVANSGCSNVAMGEQGRVAARAMARHAAKRLGVPEEDVLVGSTGVIGRPLPIDKIEQGILASTPTVDGGALFARAIMTTDLVPKQRAVRFSEGGRTYTVGGVAKGSGMVHPDMATVFCFMTTDAPAEIEWLRGVLRRAADVSLNMVDVDMDTSTSDTMLLFANGTAGGTEVCDGHPIASALEHAIVSVATALARDLARDGEGAKTLIEVRVRGAKTLADARAAARTVASSPLVKTMVTGRDPNLGRVMAAVGRSGAEVDVDRTSVFIGDACAFERGSPTNVAYDVIRRALDAPEVVISVDLGLGAEAATAWGCDLTEGYVRINASYTT